MNFGEIYDSMNDAYYELESIMGYIYSNNNRQNNEMLLALGDVAKKMIISQMHFVEEYADASMKENLSSRLEDRYEALTKALEKDTKTR